MRIIVTDTAPVWNHENPALEPFGDIVLVVCLNGKKVTDKYECFVANYNYVETETDILSIESNRYKALERVGIALNRRLSFHQDIIFLTDNSLESLFPFSAVNKLNKFNTLHLCAMSPWKFESKRKQVGYKALLSDLTSVKSFLYIDNVLSQLKPGETYPTLIKKTTDRYSELLPKILYGIQEMKQGVHYFEFASMSYVPVKKGFNGIDLSLKPQKINLKDIHAELSFCTLGVILPQRYPKNGKNTKESVEALLPRMDGKRVCNFLREQRIALAKANGILFASKKCP